jgi:pimeloyl-ACP methyl ester carboxylesterase
MLRDAGRWLHVLQMGRGAPGVVFESGIAASSLSWSRVQPQVAALTATASYDRAGLGWSESSAGPVTIERMLDDLRVVVQALSAERVVLVGHSFGCVLTLAFARRWPEHVAGVVLLDPMSLAAWARCSPEQRKRLQVGARLARRGALLAEVGLVRAALSLLARGGRRLPKLIGRAATRRGSGVMERLAGEVGKLPPETWPLVRAHWSRASSFRAMAAALEALPFCASAEYGEALQRRIPVTVLSAETATPEELREREAWVASSEGGEHRVIAGAGHWLQLDRPDTVIDAVIRMVRRGDATG